MRLAWDADGSRHCSAVLVDTPLHCLMEVGDSACWMANWVVPIFKKGAHKVCSNCGCVSASLGKLIPGCWNGGSDLLLNLRSKRTNVVSVLVVEQWTCSLLLQGWSGVMGVCPSSLHVFCGLCFLGTSHWQETLGQTQSTLETLYISSGLLGRGTTG